MTVSSDEFLRRFLIHVLPKGLVRIRHFGLFATRRRGSMLQIRISAFTHTALTQDAWTKWNRQRPGLH